MTERAKREDETMATFKEAKIQEQISKYGIRTSTHPLNETAGSVEGGIRERAWKGELRRKNMYNKSMSKEMEGAKGARKFREYGND